MRWTTIGVLVATITMASMAKADEMFVYFGSQATSPGVGFSLARFDTDTGVLTKPQLIMPADAPSYFVIHPDGKRMYSTNFSGEGGISAYRLDPKTGAMTLINRVPGNGASTTYVGLDRTGNWALAANFQTGHIASFAIKPDGSIGERVSYILNPGSSINPARQARTYPHSIWPDPTNRFALAPDLGLDKLHVYRFDEKAGTLTPNDPPFAAVKPGSGPRHMRFHPNGKWVYLLTEMGSTVVGYNWDGTKGVLTEFQTHSLLPQGFTTESTAAEIEVHPNGKFVYCSNRGHDSIAVFAIDPATGRLTLVEHAPTQGKNPRNFTFDPTSKWMLVTNQVGNNAVIFRVDPASGKLTQVGQPVEIPAPCCERFLPVQK